jgi:FkbM family methyltransferase
MHLKESVDKMSFIIQRIYDFVRLYAFLGTIEFFARMGFHRGILHAGAYLGEERFIYKSLGYERVFWIEGNPDVFQELKKIVGKDSCYQALLWSVDDIVKSFFIANNFMSSSVFALSEHNPWPNLKMVKEIQIRTKTLDTIYENGGISSHDIHDCLLVLDLQGSELDALLGAKNVLKSVAAISVEISKKETYFGGSNPKDIDDFLKFHKFKRLAVWVDPINGHGDALYIANRFKIPWKFKVLGAAIPTLHRSYFYLRGLHRRGVNKLKNV